MTEKEIFDRIVTIIQERQGEDFAVTEALSLKDDLDADSVDIQRILRGVTRVKKFIKELFAHFSFSIDYR